MGYIIFTILVLASVAQGSYVPTLTVESSGLSEQEVVLINQLIVNQQNATTVYRDILKKIFDIFSDPNANTEDDASNIYELFVGSLPAIDLDLASIPIAMGEDRSTIDDARTETYKYLEDAATRITAIFNLIRTGKYSDNLDAIGVHEAAVLENAERCVQIFYDSIRTILNTTNADMLAVIETAQDGSNPPKKHFVSAIINAMRFRAGWADAGYTDRDFSFNMKEFEDEAVFGAIRDIEYRFSLLNTLVICSNLNRSEMASKLFPNRYALIASYSRYIKGDATIFDTIIGYLRRIFLKFSDDGELDFSANDIAYRATTAYYDAGDVINYASFLALHPESSAAISAAQDSTSNANAVHLGILFDAIHAALTMSGNYPEIIKQINESRNHLPTVGNFYAEVTYGIIRNNQSFDEQTEAELVSLQERTSNGVVIASVGYLDALEVLVNAIHKNEVSDDDFSEIRAFQAKSSFGNAEVTQGLAAGVLLVLRANN